MKLRHLLLAASAAALTAGAASAETLRWARAGDALTLDPHAQNEGPTTTFLHQIYEPLLMRDHSGATVPALATARKPTTSISGVWPRETWFRAGRARPPRRRPDLSGSSLAPMPERA